MTNTCTQLRLRNGAIWAKPRLDLCLTVLSDLGSRQFIIFYCKLRTFDSSIIVRPSRTDSGYLMDLKSTWWLMWNFDISRKPAPTINKSSLPTFNFKFSSCNLLKWTYLGVCIFYCFIVNFKIFWAFNVIIWRIVLDYKSYIAMNHKNSQ